MTKIKVGAEVTMVGKVLESVECLGDPEYAHRHRVAFPTGLTLWLPANVFTSVKNPSHPEPASGYALVDGKIAWRLGVLGSSWDTEDMQYPGWDRLLDFLDPESVVELVKKGETA